MSQCMEGQWTTYLLDEVENPQISTDIFQTISCQVSLPRIPTS